MSQGWELMIEKIIEPKLKPLRTALIVALSANIFLLVKLWIG